MSLKIATLESIIATRVKQAWQYRVDINATREERNKMVAWCHSNVKGAWRSNEVFVDYFHFENDADAMMFMLKFGGSKAE